MTSQSASYTQESAELFTTAWKYPGKVTTYDASGFGANWTNPSNISADDGNAAFVNVTSTAPSDALLCGDFGFAVPGGAYIFAIEVEVEGYRVSNDVTVTLTARDYSSPSTAQGAPQDNTPWNPTASYTVHRYGSSRDDWNHTGLTAAWANDEDFCIALSVGTGAIFGATFYGDFLRCRLWYSRETGTSSSSSSQSIDDSSSSSSSSDRSALTIPI